MQFSIYKQASRLTNWRLRLQLSIKKSSKLNKNNEIEYNKYNIDSNKKECYNKNSFRESCVISENSNKEE